MFEPRIWSSSRYFIRYAVEREKRKSVRVSSGIPKINVFRFVFFLTRCWSYTLKVWSRYGNRTAFVSWHWLGGTFSLFLRFPIHMRFVVSSLVFNREKQKRKFELVDFFILKFVEIGEKRNAKRSISRKSRAFWSIGFPSKNLSLSFAFYVEKKPASFKPKPIFTRALNVARKYGKSHSGQFRWANSRGSCKPHEPNVVVSSSCVSLVYTIWSVENRPAAC